MSDVIIKGPNGKRIIKCESNNSAEELYSYLLHMVDDRVRLRSNIKHSEKILTDLNGHDNKLHGGIC